MHAYVINNWHGRALATHDRKRPDLYRAAAADFLGHSAKMRASGRILVAVCAIASLSGCNAAIADHLSSSTRAKRGVVPGNAASRPKDIIRKSECRNDNNCKQWPKTSCGKDPVDNQRRCLCADQTHPINDDCISTPQDIGMACERDIQCIQLAYCGQNASEPHADTKVCQCREEFADDDGTCSGGIQVAVSIFLMILVVIFMQNNYDPSWTA